MRAYTPTSAFTLIELLVVIAIIAIMSAIVMPSLTVANDRANLGLCQARMEQISLASRQYLEENARFPATLAELYEQRYLDDDTALLCSKTGKPLYYRRPADHWSRKQLLCSCVSPSLRDCPHGLGKARVELLVGGQVRIVRQGQVGSSPVRLPPLPVAPTHAQIDNLRYLGLTDTGSAVPGSSECWRP